MSLSFDTSTTFTITVGQLSFEFRHPSVREFMKIERHVRRVTELHGSGSADCAEEMLNEMSAAISVTLQRKQGETADLVDTVTGPVFSKVYTEFVNRVMVVEAELGKLPLSQPQ